MIIITLKIKKKIKVVIKLMTKIIYTKETKKYHPPPRCFFQKLIILM